MKGCESRQGEQAAASVALLVITLRAVPAFAAQVGVRSTGPGTGLCGT